MQNLASCSPNIRHQRHGETFKCYVSVSRVYLLICLTFSAFYFLQYIFLRWTILCFCFTLLPSLRTLVCKPVLLNPNPRQSRFPSTCRSRFNEIPHEYKHKHINKPSGFRMRDSGCLPLPARSPDVKTQFNLALVEALEVNSIPNGIPQSTQFVDKLPAELCSWPAKHH